MKINIEILDATYLVGEKEVENLRTKELVPKMVFRRKFTRASKLVVEAVNKIAFSEGRIIYGSAFGELNASSKILTSILNDEMISPTDFQNSVYNTAASYLSILHKNKKEIMTISSGDETSEKLLKMGAIKALDGDEILLLASETINIENIQEVNNCIDILESVIALKIRVSNEDETIKITGENSLNYPKSVASLIEIAKKYDSKNRNIIGIEI